MNSVDLMMSLIVNSYDKLKSFEQYKPHMLPEIFRREFGTAKIALHRGAGHTSAALRLLERFDDSLLLVTSPLLVEVAVGMIYRLELDERIRDRIISLYDVSGPAEFYNTYFAGKHRSLLMIDTSSDCHRLRSNEIDRLLQSVNSSYDLLVLLE
jgi:hypothetical protein